MIFISIMKVEENQNTFHYYLLFDFKKITMQHNSANNLSFVEWHKAWIISQLSIM